MIPTNPNKHAIILSRIEFSIPTARRCSSNLATRARISPTEDDAEKRRVKQIHSRELRSNLQQGDSLPLDYTVILRLYVYDMRQNAAKSNYMYDGVFPKCAGEVVSGFRKFNAAGRIFCHPAFIIFLFLFLSRSAV